MGAELQQQTETTTTETAGDPLFHLGTEAGKNALVQAARNLRGRDPATPVETEDSEEDTDVETETEDKEAADKKDEKKADDKAAAKGKKEEDEEKWKGLSVVKKYERRVVREAEERTAKLDEREQEITARHEQLAETVEVVKKVESAANEFFVNPVPLVEAFGITEKDDKIRIALQIYASAVGVKNLPAEYQQILQQGQTMAQAHQATSMVQQTRTEMMSELEKRQLAAEEKEYRAEIKSQAASVSADDMPHVHSLMVNTKDAGPSVVVEMLMELAAVMTKATGRVPEPDELIEQYESNLAAELEKFSGLYSRKAAKGKVKGSQTSQQHERGNARNAPRTLTPTLSPGVGRTPKSGRKRTLEERMASAMPHLKAAADSYAEHMAEKTGRRVVIEEEEDDDE